LGALALAQVAASTATGTVLTIASITALTLSGSEQIAGLVQTSTVVGASALTLPIARLASSRGRRTALAVGYGVAMLGAALAAAAVLSGLAALLLGAAMLLGGGTVAGLAARFSAAELSPGNAALAISLVLWASTAGSIVGPILAGAVATSSAEAFLLVAALYGVSAVCVLVGLPRSPARSTVAADGRLRVGDVVAVLRRRPRALIGLVVSVSVHATMIALMTLAPVQLHARGEPAAVIGLLMSAHLAGMYALSPLVGLLVRRAGAPRCAAVGLGLSIAAAALLGAGVTGGTPLFAVGLTLLGVAWSIGMIAGSTLVTESLSRRDRTATQGATDLAINLGGGAASIVAGAVVAAAGYAPLAWCFAGLGLLCLATLMTLVARRPLHGAP
jgi:MFS family permease